VGPRWRQLRPRRRDDPARACGERGPRMRGDETRMRGCRDLTRADHADYMPLARYVLYKKGVEMCVRSGVLVSWRGVDTSRLSQWRPDDVTTRQHERCLGTVSLIYPVATSRPLLMPDRRGCPRCSTLHRKDDASLSPVGSHRLYLSPYLLASLRRAPSCLASSVLSPHVPWHRRDRPCCSATSRERRKLSL
jgi:hypothetical protein